MFEIIYRHNKEINHGGRTLTCAAINSRFDNISQNQVASFVKMCETCQLKNTPTVKKHVVVKPIISRRFNARAQVDLVDFQTNPDGEFRYVYNKK